MPKLVITDSDGSRTLGLDRELKAGRLADNDIPLKVAEASRHHCRFFEEKGSWFVEDMGSSNGTLVNGRKVSKFELQDGDLISVGAVTLRFLDSAPTAEEKGDAAAAGWGDDEISLEEPEAPPPPRKQAPAPAPAAASRAAAVPAFAAEVEPEPAEGERADTKLLDSDSAFADPTFALAEVPEKKSVVPSILAVLLLLVLAGGLAWLYMNREKLAGNRATGESEGTSAASNLVARRFASFEPQADAAGEDGAGWHKEDPIDPAAAGETQEPVHSGDQAYSIARRPVEKAPAATWVTLSGGTDSDISILPGSVYRLGAMTQIASGQPIPGVVVTWIDVAGDEVREISREVVPAAAAAKKWSQASGFVQAPEGASRARVGIAAAGVGEVAFDDVVFDSAQAPPGRGATIKDFRAWVTPSGALRIFHFTRSVSDGIGIWKSGESELEPPWRLLVPRGGAGEGVAGTLRDGGDASVVLAAEGTTFRATWQMPAGAAGHTIMIPLTGNADEINVTLLDGARAKRMRAAFQQTQASGLIVGGQGDRVRIKFLDGEKKPFSAALDVVTDSGRAFVKLDRGDRATIVLEFETSFDAEMNEARGLFSKAEEAARGGRVGEAMAAYEEVLAKFPFDENLEKQASTQLEKLANEGRNKARALAAKVDDSKFFHTARLDDELLTELENDAARYAGTNLAADFTAKRDELKAERTKSAAEKHEAAAEKMHNRALDYWNSKEKRVELAVAFLEQVVNRYPNTEWAQRAQALLDQIKGGKSGGGGAASQPESRVETTPASRSEGPR